MIRRLNLILWPSSAIWLCACMTTQDAPGPESTGGLGSGANMADTGGSQGSDAGGSGGVSGALDSGVESVEPICDGSDDIRFGVTSGGGFVESTYDFTNPYGFQFLFIDGHCQYWASTSYMEGIVEGSLDATAAKDLEQAVGWANLPAWSLFSDAGCPDAGAQTVIGRGASFDCSCGCDDEAPVGMSTAVDHAMAFIADLASSGMALAGPVGLIAVNFGPDSSGARLPWPLSWDVSDVAVTYDALVGNVLDSATVVDNADDAKALRDLRKTTLASKNYETVVRVTTDAGGNFDLYIRDELPAEVSAAIGAFFR